MVENLALIGTDKMIKCCDVFYKADSLVVFVFSTTDKDTLTLPLPPLTLPPILDEWRLERERESGGNKD